jgi:hypothetical protein
MASAGLLPQRVLSVTDDPAAALRYPICAHPSLMRHPTPARRSGRMSRDRSTQVVTGHADVRLLDQVTQRSSGGTIARAIRRAKASRS